MIDLKCPSCGFEQPVAKSLPIDHAVACRRCERRAEFRQWHEAWCASRREELIRADPTLEPVLRDATQEGDTRTGLRLVRGEGAPIG
jgi:hypothetical protein